MHRIWNDNVRTYSITGRLGARKLAIRDGGMLRQTIIDDDIIPTDVVFVENFWRDCELIGFNVFIAGRLVTVKDPTTPDVQFVENPYVMSANMLTLLGRFVGATDDEEIFQAIIARLSNKKD
jgi:hypothetical protein